MSNRLFQGIIHQMKDTVNRTIGVVDENGVVISCNELVRIGDNFPDVKDEHPFLNGFVSNGVTFKPLSVHGKSEYLVFVEGDDAIADSISSVLSITFGNLKEMHDDKYDKTSFIKNVINDNILPSDIYIKAKELHMDHNTPRAVFLIKFFGKGDIVPIDLIQNLFPEKTKEYVVSASETEVALIKEFKNDVDHEELDKIAKKISDTVNAEFYLRVTIGIGTVVNNIKDLARSYKEAQVAIEVGKVFDTEKTIINYDNLGIGRIIYQLPTTLCEMFLHEVFKRGTIENLDRETFITIQAFFENNLNVSETSRKLFVHRNTLVYRLEKIRKITGLDLREFDNAITFKVALMVKKYLSSKNNKF
ncbi:MAG: helix-turn-helix domain-containing protein [Clostridia bacterium]|nr:helix-turn-helix domain-containing protein [Clostridia bacterium]